MRNGATCWCEDRVVWLDDRLIGDESSLEIYNKQSTLKQYFRDLIEYMLISLSLPCSLLAVAELINLFKLVPCKLYRYRHDPKCMTLTRPCLRAYLRSIVLRIERAVHC